ncbi:DNRLRE domain-containing protein [Streptomyces sp. NPDC059970]|uniref:DNRLRE domain-containing protein n=1 Tax=Streptomyces sp. NPDC059970 TaxID=3347019 RepID=UPI0036926C6F
MTSGKRTAAAVLVLALTGGFAAVADQGAKADSGDEPPLTQLAPDLGPAEAGSESEARLLAQAQGRRIEIVSKRTETAAVWANPDGSLTAEAYVAPVRVKESGTWRDIDTTLFDSGSSLTPRTTSTDIDVSDGDDTRLAVVTHGERSFGLGWEESLPVPAVKGDTASYQVGQGETLTVTALSDGFTQNVVLKQVPTEPVIYRIPVLTDGLRLSQADSGHLLLKDSDGRLVAEAPAPMMWDSSRHSASGEPERQVPVDTEIEERADGKQTLVLTPDPGFLATAEYPVTVDPTSTLAVTTDTWVATNYPDSQISSPELKSGTYNDGGIQARSYLKFDVSALKGKHIIDTNLSLYSTWSSTCSTKGSGTQIRRITSAWTSSAVTWGDQPETTTTGAVTSTAAKGYSSDCPPGTVDFDIDAVVQAWADGAENQGVQVRGVDENDSLTWRRYRSANYVSGKDEATEPHLSVTYDSYPSTPAAVLPFNGTVTSDATPTLRARSNDDDLDELRHTFEVWEADLSARRTTGNTAYLAPAAIASWTSPTLPSGVYKWRSRAYDSSNWSKSWSAWRTLTVDSSAPAAPTISSGSHASQTSWYAVNDFTGSLSASDTSAITGYAVKIDQNPVTAAGTEVTQTSTTVTAADRVDGTWYVHAAARNAAGLWSATRHFAFHVDTTAPRSPTIASSTHPLNTAVYASRAAAFSWTAPADGSGAAGYSVSVDRSSTTIPTTTGAVQSDTSYSTVVASDGTWYLHVRTKDRAGNWSTTAAHFPFQVDAGIALRPAITSSSHPDQSGAYRNISFTGVWETAGNAAGYSYLVDSSSDTVPDTVSDGTEASYTATKGEGTWYLHVRAVDSEGGWGPVAHYRFTIDTTAPAAPTVTSADFPGDGWAGDAGDSGTFQLTSEDAGLRSLRYRLDDGPESPLAATGATTTLRLTIADEGSHRLTAVAVDKAGNASAAATYTFHVGTAGIVSPLPGEEVGYKVPLAIAGPGDLTGATLQYRRSDTETWTDVPAADMTTVSGGTVSWPATITGGELSGLVWDSSRLATDGEIQLRARFDGPDAPAPSEPVTVILNRVDVLTQPTAADSLEPDTAESYALDVAEQRAEADPDTFAPPYLDQETRKIMLPVTDTSAKSEATKDIVLTGIPVDQGNDDGSVAGDPDTDDTAPTDEDGIADPVATQDRTIVPVSKEVDHSQSELQSIADEVLLLTDSELSGASTLATAGVDAETNRVVVEVPENDVTLADALGRRYGPDSIAIQLAPGVRALQTAASRYSDVSPFKGGAAYQAVRPSADGTFWTARCTTAFPWTHEGHPYMLSAGHCTTANGWMDSWNPELTFAGVAHDNWNNSKGSVKIAGKSYYSGDLVTGKVYDNKYSVSARIYKGGPQGTSTRRVVNRWTTRSKAGEKFCSGGSTTGEICGWKVTSGKLNIKYGDGTVIKNATRAKKNSGTCNYPGDSGGPIYTVLSSGHVYAKGVVSGGLCAGWGIGSDGNGDGWNDDKDCSDLTDYDCEIIFTDIRLAEDALPGLVKKW